VPQPQQDLVEDRSLLYDEYKALYGELTRTDPDAVVLKGFRIGDRYPPGWLRTSNDLDVALSAPELLWPCARGLGPQWTVHAFSLVRIGGRLYPSLAVTAPRDSRAQPYRGIELTTSGFVVGRWDLRPPGFVLPHHLDDEVVPQILALVEEGAQRPFHARDCLDAMILAAELSPSGGALLSRSLGTLGWWPELTRLLAAAERFGMPATVLRQALPEARVRAGLRRSRRDRLRSRAALLGTGIGRAVWLTHRLTLHREPGRPAEWLAASVQRRWPAGLALAAGLPVFGMPLQDCEASGDGRALLESPAGSLVALTPLGAFVLVYGATVREEVVAEASEALRRGATGPVRAGLSGEMATSGG